MIADKLPSTTAGHDLAATPCSAGVAPDVDVDIFRRVLSRFCTGVVVVTAMHETTPVGLTCQAFAALSLEPPLVMFAAATASTSWPRIRAARGFAVNILTERQERTSRAFAVPGADKFVGVRWRTGRYGSPLIDGALAHMQCSIEAVYCGGDHDIVVGRVLAAQDVPVGARPLLYFSSRYCGLALSGAPLGTTPVDRY